MIDEPIPLKRSAGPMRFVILIAIAFAVWGIIEHRRAQVQEQTLNDAQRQVATLEKQLAATQAQLTTTVSKLSDLARKNLPVSVVFRPARTGNGITTYFKNNSAQPIDISVLLTDPSSGRRREANLTIQGNSVQEIGESQGWVFAPGHRVQISNAMYGTVEYVVSVAP